MEFIDLKTQYSHIRAEVQRRIESVLEKGQYILGPEVTELEDRLARYTKTPHCIAVSSGTDALLISLMALGIGPGDEVITTPFSFIATSETIKLLGATPVYLDICRDTYNLDPNLLEDALTEHTKAIMPVSLYGQPADYSSINAIAEKHGLPVIEDGAQSFGATHHGTKSCNLSTIGCTSFFPSKPLGGYGDGGAIFTSNSALAEQMRHIRAHGQSKRYYHGVLGINGRLDTLQAAILLAKLDMFDREIDLRQKVAQNYDRAFDKLGIPHQNIDTDNTSVYAQYTIEVANREAVQEVLRDAGIPTAVHYPLPLYKQPACFQSDLELKYTEEASSRVLSLPMHPYLKQEDQQQVIAAVDKAVSDTA